MDKEHKQRERNYISSLQGRGVHHIKSLASSIGDTGAEIAWSLFYVGKPYFHALYRSTDGKMDFSPSFSVFPIMEKHGLDRKERPTVVSGPAETAGDIR